MNPKRQEKQKKQVHVTPESRLLIEKARMPVIKKCWKDCTA